MAQERNETQFYKLYRDAFNPPFYEDSRVLSEPMEVREYAELFSSTFRDIHEALSKSTEDDEKKQLEKLYDKFKNFAEKSAAKNNFPIQGIEKLQEEINEMQTKNVNKVNIELSKLYDKIQQSLTTAITSKAVFVTAIKKKFKTTNEELLEKCISRNTGLLKEIEGDVMAFTTKKENIINKYDKAYDMIEEQIKQLTKEAEENPRHVKIEAKLELLRRLRETFLKFSHSHMTLRELINACLSLKESKVEGVNLYDRRSIFKSSSGQVLTDVIALLKDIEKTPLPNIDVENFLRHDKPSFNR